MEDEMTEPGQQGSEPAGLKIGRRGFLAAGLTGAGATLIAHGSPPATAEAGSAAVNLSPSAVDPTTQSLVPIPSTRVAAAVGRLDEIIREVLSVTGVPGLAASVVHRGELVYAKGFGIRDLRTGAPVNSRTVFRLASVSKSLSSTVVAGIVGRGRASWTDPIVRYLPNFVLADGYVTRNVTIGDMFSHTSGLPGHAGDLLEDLGYDRSYILHALRLEKLAPFRSTYAYTNFGLTAGAVAAAVAAGSNWATIADRILFRPLGMSATSYRYSDFRRRSNRAAMHVRVNGRWLQKYTRDTDPEAPAGGGSSNVIDLARWMALTLAGGRWRDRQVVSSSALLAAATPHAVSGAASSLAGRAGFYGFGTYVGTDYSGRTRLSHTGGFFQGAATHYVLLPDQQLGIAVLTNGMPTGVPEAVNAYFMDLVVGGAIENDWLDLFGRGIAAAYINPGKLAGNRRPAHPKPARPLRFYAGKYSNSYYGPIKVIARGRSLHVLIGPKPTDYRLEHWSGDQFAFFPVGENALGISAATFRSSRSGDRAASLTLEYYDDEQLGRFMRT
jgi:CubicO group peptidase (beta-lactamase class C family)